MSQWQPPLWLDEVDPASGAVYYVNTERCEPYGCQIVVQHHVLDKGGVNVSILVTPHDIFWLSMGAVEPNGNHDPNHSLVTGSGC